MTAPEQVLLAAERSIRIMLGRPGVTAAQIARALDDQALLARTVRPQLTLLPEGGAQ